MGRRKVTYTLVPGIRQSNTVDVNDPAKLRTQIAKLSLMDDTPKKLKLLTDLASGFIETEGIISLLIFEYHHANKWIKKAMSLASFLKDKKSASNLNKLYGKSLTLFGLSRDNIDAIILGLEKLMKSMYSLPDERLDTILHMIPAHIKLGFQLF
jgi:formate dehydrogenase assembly factor FdhD